MDKQSSAPAAVLAAIVGLGESFFVIAVLGHLL